MELFEALVTLLVVVTTDNVDNVSVLVGYTLLGPLCASRAGASPHTRPILVQGWSPVLAAMVISSMGGKILNTVIARCTSAGCRSFITTNYIGRYPDIAVFQPVINGVAGNLVGIQVYLIMS